jgi:hypothetical protein
MQKRYLIIAEEWGIYFGFAPGGQGFFSLIDTIGLAHVPTFPKASVAHDHVRQWIDHPPGYRVVPIECASNYVPIWEIDRAGYGHLLGDAYASYLMRAEPAGMC